MNSKKSVSRLMLVASLSFIVAFGSFANSFQQSKSVLSVYLELKDALVKTDSKAASAAAKELVAIVDGKDDEMSKKLKTDASQILASNDVNVQRTHFNDLSVNVYAMVKNFSENEETVYKQFCPMAFNNTGAFWLASEKEINNPYFGNKMLHCGMVKEEL